MSTGAITKEKMEMKFIRNAFLITTLLALQAAAQPNLPPSGPGPSMLPMRPNPNSAPPAPPPMPDKEKMSYAIGMYFGSTIKKQELTVDIDTVTTALKDLMEGRTNHMSEEEMTATLRQLAAANRGRMQEAQRIRMAKEGLENKTKGDEFMAKNAKLDGVKTLPDGLQYKVIKEGSGEMPQTSDTVVVTYKGSLVDGTQFDSRTNWSTPLAGHAVIKGWTEILPLMKAGSEWEVVIPPDLAYGPQQRGPKIGPSSTLVFDMELVSISPPKPMAQPTGAMPPFPNGAASTGTPVVSGQIIKVPSADDLKKGAKIEVITNVPPGQ
jgi:FKBP-type peptidyl-prolyl cis-trans isomerase